MRKVQAASDIYCWSANGDEPLSACHDPDILSERKRVLAMASEQGYADGLAVARQEAEVARKDLLQARQRLEQQLHQAQREAQQQAAQLGALCGGLEAALEAQFAQAQYLAVEVAYMAIAHIVGATYAERALMAELCANALRERLSGPVTVRCAAADVVALSALPGTSVIADPSLHPGQCVLESPTGFESIGLDIRMEAIRKALLAGLAVQRGVCA